MKKKWSIRILSMLLCVVMLGNIPTYAAGARADDRIMSSTATLSKKSDGDLSVYFSVRASDVMEKIGASSVEIQRASGGGWTTEYTFTPNNATAIQTTGKTQHSAVLTYSPRFTGVEYRAKVTIYAKDSSGESTKQRVSKTVVS